MKFMEFYLPMSNLWVGEHIKMKQLMKNHFCKKLCHLFMRLCARYWSDSTPHCIQYLCRFGEFLNVLFLHGDRKRKEIEVAKQVILHGETMMILTNTFGNATVLNIYLCKRVLLYGSIWVVIEWVKMGQVELTWNAP